jgi:hypothetical protein
MPSGSTPALSVVITCLIVLTVAIKPSTSAVARRNAVIEIPVQLLVSVVGPDGTYGPICSSTCVYACSVWKSQGACTSPASLQGSFDGFSYEYAFPYVNFMSINCAATCGTCASSGGNPTTIL